MNAATGTFLARRHNATAAVAGGMCLLSSALVMSQPQQPKCSAGAEDIVDGAAATPAAASHRTARAPRFQFPMGHVPNHMHSRKTNIHWTTQLQNGEAMTQTPPANSRAQTLSSKRFRLDRLDIMNLQRREALELMHHIHQHGGQAIDVLTFMQLCQATASLLKQETTLVDKTGIETVTVVGDLHGSLASLKKIMEIIGDNLADKCIVFDGDFVDRGEASVEVLLTLLLLKIAYPDQIVLLRGNHEDSMVAQVYGFADELLSKFHLGDKEDALKEIWGPISELFAALPLGCVTDTAFIVHGGLPSADFSLNELRQLTVEERCQYTSGIQPQSPTQHMLGGLLWSDPVQRPGIHPNLYRGKGVTFGPDIAREFLARENLRYLVRGHEEVPSGYKQIKCAGNGDDRDMSVITIFSAVDYEDGNNKGSIVNFTASDGTHTPITFDLQLPVKKRLPVQDFPLSVISLRLLGTLDKLSLQFRAFQSNIVQDEQKPLQQRQQP